MKGTFLLAAGLLLLFGSACASGPKYKDVHTGIPAIGADSGRIFFYRSKSMVGSAVQPKIYLDGEAVGKSKPGGFFFADRPAGDHAVACTTEVERALTFTLEPGETKYVKTVIQMGAFVGHVKPELEDQATAMKTLEGSAYTGDTPLTP